ncbi:MAG: TolC family protein [Kofleriaceae bacterium]
MRQVLLAAAILMAPVLGCAPASPALLRPVSATLAQRGLPALAPVAPGQTRPSAAVAELLRRPLTLDAAVRVALAQNRRLQAEIEELGIAAAELTAATLPPLQLSATYHLDTVEVDALADVIGLLELAGRRRAARSQLDGATAGVAVRAIQLAAEVELAFGGVQLARARVALRQHAFDAAAAAALVRERAFEAGGGTELALARQLDQRETARSRLGRAQLELELARERLGRAMGVWGADAPWSVAEAPPALPAAAPALDELEREAVAHSLEVERARAAARAGAQEVGLARLRRWLPRLGVGAVAETVDGSWELGPAVSLSLPLTGEATAAELRGRGRLRRAEHELYASAVELRSAARSARLSALGAYSEAAHLRDVVVPLRQRILDETVRHYNAMNADTFTLLAAQQELVDGQDLLLEATARFAEAMAQVSALRRGVLPDAMRQAPAQEPSMPAAETPSLHVLH